MLDELWSIIEEKIVPFLRIFKLFLIVFFYISLLTIFGLRAALPIALLMGLSLVAFIMDKEREELASDYFRGDLLFYRCGTNIDRFFFAIPVDRKWTTEEAFQFSHDLRARLATAIQKRLPDKLVQVTESLRIKDMSTQEEKVFLRVHARSKYGSKLWQFVHFAPFGNTITAHYFTYRRGSFSDWLEVEFLLTSPFTIWIWAIPWFLNRYSIVANLCRYRASSFDGIDFQTLYSMTNDVLLTETEVILHQEGLLTEEARQVLHLHKHVQSQRINIRGAGSVMMGNVSQTTVQPAGA